MYKRLVALSVTALAGTLALVAGGHSAYAVAAPDEAVAPAAGSHMVTVQSGDYLDKLASDNGTTFLRLFYANDEIKDPNLIYPGEQLRVPGSTENLTARSLPEAVTAPVESAAPTVQPSVPQPVATPAPAPAPAPRPAPVTVAPAATGIWDQLAACESGGNWAINTGNGFYGGLQFTLSSWQAMGGSGYPYQASRDEQIYRAQLLQARQGWGAWPACSAKLGLL